MEALTAKLLLTRGTNGEDVKVAAEVTLYTYNALNQLTEASDGTTYSYDGAGRMTGQLKGSEETTYEWSLLDHLAKVEGPSETTSYGYDGLERLSERKGEAGTTVLHYGDLTDLPTYLANGGGETTMSYVQGAHGLVEQRAGGSTSFPLSDAHGDVTGITGPAGEVESRQSYGPWGEQVSGPGLEMGYLGAWERPADASSGLIQMGARSYDPSLGRFLSEDSMMGHLGVGVSADRYAYVRDNPLNRYDLNGRDVCAPTPFGDACAGDAAEGIAEGATDVAESVKREMEKNVGQDQDAANAVAGLSKEVLERRVQEGREQVQTTANAASDFWKEYHSPLEQIYNFAGANWENCAKGAGPGAAIGASVGSAAFGVGAVPGGIGGGLIGCGTVVGTSHLLELGL